MATAKEAVGNDGYRHEIDGLRAISVLVIILFHLKVAGFQGGFIGVDIFSWYPANSLRT
jgi:peptidoglycan/LPS O-acetylase OafA/YrhL